MKTKALNFFIIFLITISASLHAAETKSAKVTGWDMVPQILKKIVPPKFPNKDYDIRKFGAIADGKTDCSQAFERAIETCSDFGGGRIIVSEGTYLSKGPIHLKSNVNLHIKKSASIVFSTDPKDYLPLVHVRWEGTECYNYSPMIYAYKEKNIALTGGGTIDAQSKETWAKWKKKQGPDKKILRQMGNDLVPVKERIFGEGHFLRPSMVQLFDCENILIEGITIKDSPFWVVHPTYCKNVTVRKITVDSWNTNNDGCDPDSCTDVLIEDCLFKTGDDSVAIKAGRDQDAWRAGKRSENIIVRNSKLRSRCNGLCIGSEMSGGVRNIFMENCQLDEAGSVLFFKSNLDRGGCIENVFARNITVNKCKSVVKFTNGYHGYRGNYFPTRFQRFQLENINCDTTTRTAISIGGVKDAFIKNVLIKNMNIKKAEKNTSVKFIDNVVFENVTINGKKQKSPESTPENDEKKDKSDKAA